MYGSCRLQQRPWLNHQCTGYCLALVLRPRGQRLRVPSQHECHLTPNFVVADAFGDSCCHGLWVADLHVAAIGVQRPISIKGDQLQALRRRMHLRKHPY